MASLTLRLAAPATNGAGARRPLEEFFGMPIYEYACDQCSNRFEKLVPNMEAAVSCPQCESANLRRLPSVFASPSSGPSADAMPPGCGRCGSNTPGVCNLN